MQKINYEHEASGSGWTGEIVKKWKFLVEFEIETGLIFIWRPISSHLFSKKEALPYAERYYQ